MLENRFVEQDTVLDKVVFVEAVDDTPVAYAMTPRDYVVRAANDIDVDSDAGDVTITLPNVRRAMGRIYTILATAIANAGTGAAGNIVVTNQGDDSNFEGDFTLTAAGDRVVLYSDGFSWHALAETTT